MGTPAILTITDEYGEQVFYRRHYDGNPEYVLLNLAPVLERMRAVPFNDSYGLRLGDVASLVAWVGVNEEDSYKAYLQPDDLPNGASLNRGKFSTWRQVENGEGWFEHYYVLDLETCSLYESTNA